MAGGCLCAFTPSFIVFNVFHLNITCALGGAGDDGSVVIPTDSALLNIFPPFLRAAE